jgi:phosphohistidine phosphatase
VTPDAGPRLLLLVRHAKSAWPDVADHERPLAPRGRRQAPLVGAWLRDHGYRPDLVLCSTATRARETWQLITGELETSPRVTPEQRIYGAAGTVLLDLVRQTPQAVSTLLLVGHDPGVPDLAGTLAGDCAGGAAAGTLRRMAAKFPTGAVAVLTVAGAWRDLDYGGARLTDFVVPRDLER